MNKIFDKMYKDLVITNYFIFRYNARLNSTGDIYDTIDEDAQAVELPN